MMRMISACVDLVIFDTLLNKIDILAYNARGPRDFEFSVTSLLPNLINVVVRQMVK